MVIEKWIHTNKKSIILVYCKMVSKISEGVIISVETFYQSSESDPMNQQFLFSYRITIENKNPFSIQLLRRHWFIYDSNGFVKEVEGEGVVGIQPLIHTNESFQYVSACCLQTELGKMEGTYLLQNQNNKKNFSVLIPSFILQAPSKLN